MVAIHTLQKNRAIKDRITLALEAKKKAKWLKLIQDLPEMRPEQIESATTSTLSLEEQLIAAANSIIDTGF